MGLDGKIPQPGYIIGPADELLAGRVNGGRISAVNDRVITSTGMLMLGRRPSPAKTCRPGFPRAGLFRLLTVAGRLRSQRRTVRRQNGNAYGLLSPTIFLQQYRVTG